MRVADAVIGDSVRVFRIVLVHVVMRVEPDISLRPFDKSIRDRQKVAGKDVPCRQERDAVAIEAVEDMLRKRDIRFRFVRPRHFGDGRIIAFLVLAVCVDNEDGFVIHLVLESIAPGRDGHFFCLGNEARLDLFDAGIEIFLDFVVRAEIEIGLDNFLVGHQLGELVFGILAYFVVPVFPAILGHLHGETIIISGDVDVLAVLVRDAANMHFACGGAPGNLRNVGCVEHFVEGGQVAVGGDPDFLAPLLGGHLLEEDLIDGVG